jgi:hypothetical protein
MILLSSCLSPSTVSSNRDYATICIGDHEGEDVTFEVHHSDVLSYVRNAKPKEPIVFSVDSDKRELIANCDSIGEFRWTIVPKRKGEYPNEIAVFDNLGSFQTTIPVADVEAAMSIIDRCDLEATRYTLGCVCFEERSIVATDGRRMALEASEAEYSDKAVVPKTMLEYASKFGFEIDVFKGRMIAGDLIMSIVDGRFPTWQQVLPSDVTLSCDWDGDAIRKLTSAFIATQKAAKVNDDWGIEIALGDGVKGTFDSRFIKTAIGDLASIRVSYDTKAQKKNAKKQLTVPVVLTSDERPSWTEVIMPMTKDR